ncbi:MAG: hypothetical protein JWM21_2037 [Acidobacteria bacterium]|nr:hypothetical protein [Acidobacteriota bacterium]
MAESDKTAHISDSLMERFCMRTLSEAELTNVAGHLTGCPDCQAEFVSMLRRQRGVAGLSFSLAPEFWLRHEHLDYEHLVELGEGKLDATDREYKDAHLKVCPACREDVQSFLAFREQIAPEMRVSYAPVENESVKKPLPWLSWWRGRTWSPVYSAALVAIGIALVIGAALLLNRRAENQQAQQEPTPQVSPSSAPEGHLANLPSPPASPGESPSEKPTGAEALVVLNDRGGAITVDKSGNVTGLEDVPASTRNEIAQVLLSERLDAPAILKELRGQEGGLRGSNNKQPFKLISPSRSVIVSDFPMFSWEKAQGASAYKVYVNDLAGHEVARSEELPAESIKWRVQKALKRGDIYSWTVVAVVDGMEIVSPGPSSPELRFQILPQSQLSQLRELKKTQSHLALAVFYSKVGMVAEAEQELKELQSRNPGSQKLRALLSKIRRMD